MSEHWPNVLRVTATIGLLAVAWNLTYEQSLVVLLLILFVWVWGR